MEESKYFFSYAREDSAFVLRLANELREAGLNLWLDQLDILGGQRWDRRRPGRATHSDAASHSSVTVIRDLASRVGWALNKHV